MKQCDVCLKQTEEELLDLLEQYQTAQIKHVCYDCNEVLNKQLRELREVTHGIFKAWFIRLLEEKRRKAL